MCGSPKIDTSFQDFQIEEADRARAEEESRQGRIDEGMATINAVFGGGEGVDQAGNPITYAGTQPVLDQRRSAQEDFFFPQLDKQFGTAKDELTFALSRAGLGSSTAAGKKSADLTERFALEKSGVLSRIAGDIAGARTNIGNQRRAIEAQLRSSADATASTNDALSSVLNFREDQPVLSPLPNVLASIAQNIGSARTGFDTGRISRISRGSNVNNNLSRTIG